MGIASNPSSSRRNFDPSAKLLVFSIPELTVKMAPTTEYPTQHLDVDPISLHIVEFCLKDVEFLDKD